MKISRVILYALFIAVAFAGVETAVRPSGADTAPAFSTQGAVRTPTNEAGGMAGFDIAIHLTNQTLATQAELIVIGECTATASVWIDRNLYTLATISISETLKGDSTPAVTVALPGGVDANRRFPVAVTYPGAASIAPHEEVFLFLNGADDEVWGSYAVMGSAQGKFSIVPGEQGPVVARSRSGLRLLGREKQVAGDDRPVSLSAFREEIRGYLKRP